MQFANNIFFAEVERMLAKGCEVQFRVKGFSMRPLLRTDRDIVVLAPRDGEPSHKGDIVLFRYHGRHILHRIVRIESDRLTLEGDGNYRQQEHCAPDDVVGIARRVIRRSGRVVECSSTWWRLRSRVWRALPPLVRRYTLAALFRLGWK